MIPHSSDRPRRSQREEAARSEDLLDAIFDCECSHLSKLALLFFICFHREGGGRLPWQQWLYCGMKHSRLFSRFVRKFLFTLYDFNNLWAHSSELIYGFVTRLKDGKNKKWSCSDGPVSYNLITNVNCLRINDFLCNIIPTLCQIITTHGTQSIWSRLHPS